MSWVSLKRVYLSESEGFWVGWSQVLLISSLVFTPVHSSSMGFFFVLPLSLSPLPLYVTSGSIPIILPTMVYM